MTIKHSGLKKSRQHLNEKFYSELDSIDGSHPWMKAVPNGFVAYSVRRLDTGKVAYFNFVLAKEMGIISGDHPHLMNEELEEKLIHTFSLQIINEYDELSKKRLDPETILPNKFMATRYLQLQHANKQGKTSGDGRGIWNGTISHKGKTWDVSSRGTGVTCLAPGSVEAKKFLKTGGTEFGYGCGLAEIDELIGASILAEVMHLQGVQTERVLCVIDLGKGFGIGVRAAPNLIRPAHLFLYLKQERLEELKSATDYFINRQIENGVWKDFSKNSDKYNLMLDYVSKSFAHFTAKLDVEYIFAWLDWDGDNVLADAGIIDYGSVRQFGLRHDKYRYDDVDRFSTNLNEQRKKAALIIQVFAQLVDYLNTGIKKPLKKFSNDNAVKKFHAEFEISRSNHRLYKMGFNSQQREKILNKKDLFNQFEKAFSYLERVKISGQTTEVADGVNHPPLFNALALMRLLPETLITPRAEIEIFNSILTSFATTKDHRMGDKHQINIQSLLKTYKQMFDTATSNETSTGTALKAIVERVEKLNSEQRITGNALIEMVDEILSEKKKGLALIEIQRVIDKLVMDHLGAPEIQLSSYYKKSLKDPEAKPELITKLLKLVEVHKEDI